MRNNNKREANSKPSFRKIKELMISRQGKTARFYDPKIDDFVPVNQKNNSLNLQNIRYSEEKIKEIQAKYPKKELHISLDVYSRQREPEDSNKDLYARDFVIDFDGKGSDHKSQFESAKEDVLLLLKLICENNNFQIPIDAIQIYYTGNRGFHLHIPYNFQFA